MANDGFLCVLLNTGLYTFTYSYIGSCCLGMLHSKCRCFGDLVFLMFLMVFGRVLFSHQFCFLDGLLAALSGSGVGW